MVKHTCVGRKDYHKIEIVPNSIYNFNIIPNKISKVFFMESYIGDWMK